MDIDAWLDPGSVQKPRREGNIVYFPEVVQGSDEWLEARRGLLTASEMEHILTPTLKIAKNDKTSQHVYEIAAQRITGYVEPRYVGDDMLRGHADEMEAKIIYNAQVAPLHDVGFVTNDRHRCTIGYSPDGLVAADGLIEIKSRRQKYQIQTIAEHVATGCETIPADYVLQCQTGLLVTERDWLDFISYSGGLPMCIIRVYPDEEVQQAIIEAAQAFEDEVQSKVSAYHAAIQSDARMFPTERREEEEMFI